MGDKSCFMMLPGGAPVAGGNVQGKKNDTVTGPKASNYCAKALQEEEYCFGANNYNKPQENKVNNPAPAPLQNNDPGDRSCFMGPPKL